MKLTTPHRIFPGKLSVSRAFGDIEAKYVSYGGNPDVLISKPEITNMKLAKDYDFIVMGSDGVFDRLSNEEIIGFVWDIVHDHKNSSIHEIIKLATERILKEAMLKKAFDNLTVIVLAFSNLVNKIASLTDTGTGSNDFHRPQSKGHRPPSSSHSKNTDNINGSFGANRQYRPAPL
eukprot:CAMPEP_0114584758 /NCGR_PEP_ID=MMETSP0125-20121206/8406_1 /TAXON_ID=485358 ORGANISM="Aristerostoma sp., Strain ATCC 50986" /NCGR_SAMPLE_ID=MMETSP0125 /ASSEMBLY_ACC=CAM_ASM_000245 /LENGTH=175 /DNA_ID=CAMNT_0001779365 /DNA_START=1057 /DNA_END=1584 /DNA_ORIENTATION=-